MTNKTLRNQSEYGYYLLRMLYCSARARSLCLLTKRSSNSGARGLSTFHYL